MASKLEQIKLLELEKSLSLLDRQWKQISDTAYKVLRKAEKEAGPKDEWTLYTIKHLEPFLAVAPDMYTDKVKKDINELRNITARLNTQGRKSPPVIEKPNLINHLLEYFKNKVLKEKLDISTKIEAKKKETEKINNPLSHGNLFHQMSGLDTSPGANGKGDVLGSLKDRIKDSLGVDRSQSLLAKENRGNVAKKVAGKSLGGMMHFAGLLFDSPGLNMLASSYNTKYNAVMQKRDQTEIALKKKDMDKDMELSAHAEFLNAGKMGQRDISDVSKAAKERNNLYDTPPYAFAGGGSFVTKGKQNITVGDNPGGQERVDVTPLSGIGKTKGPGVANGEGQVVKAIKDNTEILKQMLGIDQALYAEEKDRNLKSAVSTIKNADTSETNVIKPEDKKETPASMLKNLKENLISKIMPSTPGGMMKAGGTVLGAGVGGYGGYKAGSGLAEMLGAEEGGTMSKIAGGVGGAAGAIGGGLLGNKMGGKFAKSKIGGMLGGLMSSKEGTPVYVTNANEITGDGGGGGIGDMIGDKVGGKFGSKLLGKGAGLLGKAGGLLGGAAKFAGPIGAAITAGMAVKGGVSGWGNAEAIADTKGKKATGLQKAGSAVAGAASSLTMGLIDAKTIYKGFEGMAAFTPAGALYKMWEGMSKDSDEQTGLLARLKSGVAGAASSYKASREKGGGFFESVGAAAKGAYQGASGKAGEREKMLEKAAIDSGMTDPKELASFMGQAKHESAGFTAMKEFASGSAYEGRKDLGNTAEGDGKKYKGRGFFQLTGKANYADMSKKLGVDLVTNPDLAEDPQIAAKIALQYWKDKNLGAAAKAGDTEKVTRKINGGMNGYADRLAATQGYNTKYAEGVNAKSPTSNIPVPAGVAAGADTTKLAAAQQYNASPTTQMTQKVAEEKARKEFIAKEQGKGNTNVAINNNGGGGSQAPRGPIYTGDNASFPARMSRAVS